MPETTPPASPLLNPESLAPYFARLAERQGELATALKDSQSRAQRLGSGLMETFLASQQDALELTRQFALKPQDYAANLKAMVDATANAQERAITLAKLFYKEQSEASDGLRNWMRAAGNTTEMGRTLANFWTRQ